ncbi:MAG: hypothetical protein AAGJ19_18900 [Myxococcota bacterium]
MNRFVLPGVALLAAPACGADPVDEDWRFLGALSFEPEDGQALTASVVLGGGAGGFALLAELDGCANIARLEDESVWVERLERGPSCQDCRGAFSMVAGRGLWVHAPRPAREGLIEVRLGRIDCRTLIPARPEEGGRIKLWARALPADRNVSLAVVLREGPDASPLDPEALLARAGAYFQDTGVELMLRRNVQEASLPRHVEWFEGAPESLPSKRHGHGLVEVLRTGCLERVHPQLGSRRTLDGLVPRVPALAGPNGAVYLRQLACGGTSKRPLERSLEQEAKLLAHELGHYLGLHHVDEGQGREDALMRVDPLSGEAHSFSPDEARRLRLHAILVADSLPH